jgi:hypothetical protein
MGMGGRIVLGEMGTIQDLFSAKREGQRGKKVRQFAKCPSKKGVSWVYVSSGAQGFGVFLAARSAAKNTPIFLPTLERQGQIGPQSDMHPVSFVA